MTNALFAEKRSSDQQAIGLQNLSDEIRQQLLALVSNYKDGGCDRLLEVKHARL